MKRLQVSTSRKPKAAETKNYVCPKCGFLWFSEDAMNECSCDKVSLNQRIANVLFCNGVEHNTNKIAAALIKELGL